MIKNIIFDLNGILTESQQTISQEIVDILHKLWQNYNLIVLDEENCDKIYKQLNCFYPIRIFGNYGLECKFSNINAFEDKYRYSTISDDILPSKIDKKYGITSIINNLSLKKEETMYFINSSNPQIKYKDIKIIGIQYTKIKNPQELLNILKCNYIVK